MALIGLCLTVYFSYHLIAGHRGYVRLMTLESRIEAETVRFAALEQQKAALEKKVVMMRPGSICPDLLEERARLMLGYQKSNDIVLLHNSL